MEPATFNCIYCEKKFNKRSNCTRHVQNVHKKNSKGDPISEKDIKKEQFVCVICGKKFNWKTSLQRHLDAVHLSVLEDSRLNKCHECSYSTYYKSCLKRHMATHNNIKKAKTKEDKQFQCYHCGRTFIKRRSLKYHIDKYHLADQSKSIYRRKCCICSQILYGHSLEVIRSHFEKSHNIPMKWENHSFDSMLEFELWKKSVEKETTSVYVLYYTNSSVKVYKCHRSGMYRKRGFNKRAMKLIGSCKTNTLCPSLMRMKIKENKVLVSYLPNHVGHKNELKHIPLRPEERNLIVSKLTRNIPHEEILKSVHGTVTNSDSKIAQSTNINDGKLKLNFSINEEEIKHPFDIGSVELWVEKVKTSNDTALISYKREGKELDVFPHLKKEDFLLIFMTEAQKSILQKWGQDTICIEMVHDLNHFNFKLYALLSFDETQEGFPVAFMLTNNGDSSTLLTFFDEIKSVTGPIKCNVFISDIEETFYQAWSTVMGPANSNILCTWLVLKDWKTNLNNKIKNLVKRLSTKKILLTVLYELNEMAFVQMLNEFLLKLREDEETVSFCDYFEKQYVLHEQFRKWAFCYRIKAGNNTNMSIDNFNRALKHCYLKEEKVKWMNKSFCAVLTLLKDKLFDLMLKMKKQKLVKKLQILRNRHKSSFSLDPNTISQVEVDQWYVSSQNSDFYKVRKVKYCNNCAFWCSHCNTCVHEFVCSCVDSTIKNNMCKHIHLVKRTCNERREFSNEVEECNFGVDVHLDTSDVQNSLMYEIIVPRTEEDFLDLKKLDPGTRKNLMIEKIKAYQDYFIANVTTNDQMDYLEKHFEQAAITIDAMNKSAGDLCEIQPSGPAVLLHETN